MAGDVRWDGGWVKMRWNLISSPRLIRMARELRQERSFREWLVPGGDGVFVSDHALRCVTVALLGVTWCAAREHGKRLGPDSPDFVLPLLCLDDLDNLSGAPCIGRAMGTVGWAREEPGAGVILPNFQEHNVPRTSAGRVRDYRTRQNALADVTARNAPVTPAKRPCNAPQNSTVLGEESPKNPSCSEADRPPAEPPVLAFPCVGKTGAQKGLPSEWGLTGAKLAEYKDAFPGVDVLQECKKARQWLIDNPSRRKTRRGMGPFLWRWLARAQDRGPPRGAGADGTTRGWSGLTAEERARRLQAERERNRQEKESAAKGISIRPKPSEAPP
jgi:hypothetical protein